VPAGSSVNGTSQRYKYVATSGQTSFSGTDASGNTLTYDAGFIDVYLNGVHLDPTDYTATTGTSIVLGSGAALNDELYVVAFGTFNVASFNGSGLDDNTVNISKLNATGTRDGTTFLAGDNTFKTVSVTPTAVSDQANTSTGYFDLPAGTTAQRPVSPHNGMTRFNTTTGYPEWYSESATSWVPFSEGIPYSVEYLVIAGGGSGALGGGGAGGYRASTTPVTSGLTYTVTIGAGGASQSNTRDFAGLDGSASSIGVLISSTGGGGGGAYGDGGVAVRDGRPGGSGGGGGGLFTAQTNTPGGAATLGQGFAGGRSSSTVNGTAGGGGGAGAVGVDGTANSSPAGNGGAGVSSTITGTAVTRGGGGGAGCSVSGSPGVGGAGGGGNGTSNATGGAGSVNTGGGGGGGSVSGAGGSGLVVIRYLGAQRGSGGTVTSSGGYTIHTFTSSGTFTA
jgi:hypothetical protein